MKIISPRRARALPHSILCRLGFGSALLFLAFCPGRGTAQSPTQPPAVQSAPLPAPAPKGPAPSRFEVVIDAAHGGDDGGGMLAASVPEKTVTLALSVRLRSLLSARGFSVATTREGNVNLTPDARAQAANHAVASAGSSACLVLHASQTGTGVHIFVSALAPAEGGRFLAWKTAQAVYVTRSLRLAGTINSALEHSAGSGDAASGQNDTPAAAIPGTLGRASLPGVDSMTCPAVAIEVAPLRGSDGKVVTEVTDPQYQSQIIEALASALLEWKTDAETNSAPHSGGSLP